MEHAHNPLYFVAASYTIVLGTLLVFWLSTQLRMGKLRKEMEALDED